MKIINLIHISLVDDLIRGFIMILKILIFILSNCKFQILNKLVAHMANMNE